MTDDPKFEELKDEVLLLGSRLGATMKRERELELKSKEGSNIFKIYAAGAADDSGDENSAICDMIAATKARSLSGAAIQIVEAMNRIYRVWSEVEGENASFQNKRDIRAINRLLFSALDQVEEKANRKIDELVHPHFLSCNLNPWVPAEDRVKAIEDEINA